MSLGSERDLCEAPVQIARGSLTPSTSQIKQNQIHMPLILENPQTALNTPTDFLPLLGTDHIEFYVGNAKQSAHFYEHAFGFEMIGYAGPETGVKDRASYVLQQGKIRLVLTTSLVPSSEISEHVRRHGDGVKVMALWVEDARLAYAVTLRRGA